jgi:hypothetical protein
MTHAQGISLQQSGNNCHLNYQKCMEGITPYASINPSSFDGRTRSKKVQYLALISALGECLEPNAGTDGTSGALGNVKDVVEGTCPQFFCRKLSA